MKKFAISVAALLLLSSLALGAGRLAMRQWPQGRIYNYLEEGEQGLMIENLDTVLAARQSDRILLFDKETLQVRPLADSVFDQTKVLPALLKCEGDTVYYTCFDAESLTLGAYAMDLLTCEKRQVYFGSAVTNDAGFLSMDKVLGFVLRSSDIFSASGTVHWLNASGLHDGKERLEKLRQSDPDDQYGLFDGMNQWAETDEEVYFINFYGELVRFSQKERKFSVIAEAPVQDFFLTDEQLYYTAGGEHSLYQAQPDGTNRRKIGETEIRRVAFAGARIFLQNGEALYEIKDHGLEFLTPLMEQNWTTDGSALYLYSPESGTVTTRPLAG